jgi:VWFA-related protein
MIGIARVILLLNLLFTTPLSSHPQGNETKQGRDANTSQPSRIVVIDAQVLNKKTYSFVDGLKAEDLVIFEDSTRRTILEVKQEQKPLSLVILLDTSGSMRKLIGEIAARLRPALRNLTPKDEVALITFSQTAKVVRSFTSDPQSIIEDLLRIDETSAKGSTAIHEAVYQAAVYLKGGSKGERQRAIVVVTDNASNEGNNILDTVIDLC